MLNLIMTLLQMTHVHAAPIPQDWFVAPEDSVQSQPKQTHDRKEFETLLDHIFEADGQALEGVTNLEEVVNATPVSRPSDWTPWHAEFFMTDLGVTASGTLGVLGLKGNPAVSLIWRQQNEKVNKPTLVPTESPSQDQAGTAIELTDDTTQSGVNNQVDSAVKAVLATGKVKDEAPLRKNLNSTVQRFQALTAAMDSLPDSLWWPSRFRLDVTIDASGNVLPFLSIGGDVKVRLDWHRLKHQSHLGNHVRNVSAFDKKLQSNLERFIATTAMDLEELADSSNAPKGFKAYGFRVGLGFTASGNIGIVKSSASVLGQIYFSRDVKKPLPRPVKEIGQAIASDLPDSILLIETKPTTEHLKFAGESLSSYESITDDQGDQLDQVAYKIDRAKFREGLRKALVMSGSFTQRASTRSVRRWKPWELRTSFDMSITGSLAFATIGGLGTAEIQFYNQSF